MTAAAAAARDPALPALVVPGWERITVPGHGPGVALTVDDEPVWFASQDLALDPGPEAATCLLAYPALASGRALSFAGPAPPPAFRRRVDGATALMGRWWGHEPLAWSVGSAPAVAPPPPAAPRRTALFFSGGIDSFYSWHLHPETDLLVFISGLDVRLDNPTAAAAMTADFRALAARRGVGFAALATNLRDHHLLGRQRWARYYVAGLTTVAHLLRRAASRFLISASFQADNQRPWGSHPQLDHRWGDECVQISHAGVRAWRGDKLRALAGNGDVHALLRVCYPAPPPGHNCGRCEKCLRTRLLYATCLPGIACATLPDEPPLAGAIDAIPRVDEGVRREVYAWVLDQTDVSGDLRRAVAALVARSQLPRKEPPP